jgi:hypothetical protein
MAGDKEGKYCSVCGGIVPDEVKIRKICIDGKETGIDQLDRILSDVAALRLRDEDTITAELLKRVRVFNYVPAKKEEVYANAILAEYREYAKNISGEVAP